MLIPGTILEHRYELLGVLGEGGMATVWKARHVGLRSLHAVKILDPRYAESEEMRARFLAEGRIQAQLRHPHIVPVTDILTAPVPALVLEYVEGPTLDTWLASLGRRPTLDEVRAVFLPVLEAVGAAHEAGIVHRDLKPENIILAREPGGDLCPMIGDFGIAKVADGSGVDTGKHRTQAGQRLGTTRYMSPEQVRGDTTLDHRSDLFSLGCILYELLSGHSPFDADSDYVTMTAIVEGVYPDLATITTGLPPSLYTCVRRALARDAAERFPHCGAMALALTGLGEATATLPVGPPPTRAPPPVPASPNEDDEDDNDAPTTPGAFVPPPPPPPPPVVQPPGRSWGWAWLVAGGTVGVLGLWAAVSFALTMIPAAPSVVVTEPGFLAAQGYTFVQVPAATFTMGSPAGEPGRWKDEGEHPVTLTRPYALGVGEVTRGLWAAVDGAPPGADAALPAGPVAWLDAVAFCNRVSAREGLRAAYVIAGSSVTWDTTADGYRLPTEAEWEAAARAGAAGPFAGGADVAKVAWIDRTAGGSPRPVRTLAPNALGLYDMSGNVAEWTWDWYGPYANGPVTDPVGPATAESRVHRGGAWNAAERYARVAYRRSDLPNALPDGVGVRLARTASPPGPPRR